MKSSVTNTLSIMLIGIFLVGGAILVGKFVYAQGTLDIKTPGGNEPFGGEKKGIVTIVPKEHSVNIIANLTTPPAAGKVFEGWLADVGGSGYKLSLGEFSKNGTLDYKGTMVNPYTYTQFLVTQEPFEDPDPNAASVIAGAKLVSPFGQ